MRIGGSDGKDNVYKIVSKPDFQELTVIFAGDIILERGESINAVVPDTSFNISASWRWISLGGPGITLNGEKIPFTNESGPGSLFVTDRRLVFLRRPDLSQLRKNYDIGGRGGIPSDILGWVLGILNTNSLEYCEIRLEDIAKFKERRSSGRAYIDLGTDKFQVWVDKGSWQVIGPMLKKRPSMSGSAVGR